MQASWGELEAMVRWFGFGCQADNTAQLLFSPLLSKENRAAIHEYATLLTSDLLRLTAACQHILHACVCRSLGLC